MFINTTIWRNHLAELVCDKSKNLILRINYKGRIFFWTQENVCDCIERQEVYSGRFWGTPTCQIQSIIRHNTNIENEILVSALSQILAIIRHRFLVSISKDQVVRISSLADASTSFTLLAQWKEIFQTGLERMMSTQVKERIWWETVKECTSINLIRCFFVAFQSFFITVSAANHAIRPRESRNLPERDNSFYLMKKTAHIGLRPMFSSIPLRGTYLILKRDVS